MYKIKIDDIIEKYPFKITNDILIVSLIYLERYNNNININKNINFLFLVVLTLVIKYINESEDITFDYSDINSEWRQLVKYETDFIKSINYNFHIEHEEWLNKIKNIINYLI